MAITIKQKLAQFEETNKATFQTMIINSIFKKYSEISQIPTEKIISTNSNLNSVVFQEIMCTIGLKTDYYEQSYKMIDEVLLNMRNNIAHGERLENISLDEKRYNEIHKIILELIDHFAIQVMNAACLKVYLAKNDEPIF